MLDADFQGLGCLQITFFSRVSFEARYLFNHRPLPEMMRAAPRLMFRP